MFRSTTIIRELQYPCQSRYYLTTVVCMLSVVVWQHIILFGSVCAQTYPNNMILVCCHTTKLSVHTTVVK